MDRPNEELSANSVCANLRQHPVWAPIVSQLLQSDERHWKEASLGTHDIALSIPRPYSDEHDIFRLLLLTPSDVANDSAWGRIHQLSRLGNRHNAALVFLVHHQEVEGGQPAMQPFMELHINLGGWQRTMFPNHNLPIIPVPSPTADSLRTTLTSFQTSLQASKAAQPCWWPADAARDLLPYCRIGGSIDTTSNANASASANSGNINTREQQHQVLGRRFAEALSGTWFGFRELLGAIATEEGQREIRGSLGDGEAEGLVAFWEWEFATA